MFKGLAYGLMALAIATTGCSTHRANIDMAEYKSEMPIKGGSFDGEELGPVAGEDGGFVWSNCTEQSRGSIQEMIHNAKAKGANAIGNVKWYASQSSEPTCKKGWGYTLIPVFLFTPLFMSTRVEGIAYKVSDSKAKKAGLMILPTTIAEEEAFIQTVLSM